MECDNSMKSNPAAWRADVQPLIKVAGKRDAEAKHKLKERLIDEEKSFNETGTIEDMLLLNKRRFKSFKKQWDQMSSSSASSLFEEELEKQKGEHSVAGEDIISVPDVKRMRSYAGKTSSTTKQTVKGYCDGVEHTSAQSRSRSRPGSRTRKSGGQEKVRSRGRSRRRSTKTSHSEHVRPPRRSGSSDLDRFDTDLHGDVGDSNPKLQNRTVSSSSRKSQPSVLKPLTRQNLGKHSSDTADDIRGVRRRLRTKAPSEATEGTMSKGGKLIPLEIMREKAAMKELVIEVSQNIFGPKSAAKKLQMAISKLGSTAETSDILSDAKKAFSKCQVHQMSVVAMRDKIDALAGSALEGFKADVAALQLEAEASIDICRDLLDAVAFAQSQGQKETRNVTNQIRYQRRRMTSRLTSGGYGPAFAKILMPMLEKAVDEPPVEPSAFVHDKIQMWDKENDVAKKVHDFLLKGDVAQTVSSKKAALIEALNLNDAWGGGLGCLGGLDDFLTLFPHKAMEDLMTGKGAEPWLCAVRPWSFRFGCGQWPLLGFGSYVLPVSQTLIFILVPIDAMLAMGIALGDFPKFAETASGTEYLEEHAKVLMVPEGAVAWIPYGWITLPLNWRRLKASADDEKAEKEGDPLQKASDKQDKTIFEKASPQDMSPAFAVHVPYAFQDDRQRNDRSFLAGSCVLEPGLHAEARPAEVVDYEG